MERQPERRPLRDLEEGSEVTVFAKVVSVDRRGGRSLVLFPDGSEAWIAWQEDTLFYLSDDVSVYTDTET